MLVFSVLYKVVDNIQVGMSPVVWFIPEEGFKYIATEQLCDRHRGNQLLSLHHHCPLSFLATLWMMCYWLSSPARSLFRIFFRALLMWGLNTRQSYKVLIRRTSSGYEWLCCPGGKQKVLLMYLSLPASFIWKVSLGSVPSYQKDFIFRYLCHFHTLNSVHLKKTPLYTRLETKQFVSL